MGKYFLMSRHFNKQSAQDFGLSEKDEDLAVCLADRSLWRKTSLYDFGWGEENGYYKVPLPDFFGLLEILLHAETDEDVYGAAAMIERKYPEELLRQCESFINDPMRTKDFEKLYSVFHLNDPFNRCSILGKTYSEIKSDTERWKKVSEYVSNKKGKDRFFRRLLMHY